MPPNDSLSRPLLWLVILQSLSQQTDIVPIPVRYAKLWEVRWCIGRIRTSTIVWSRTTVESNSGTIPCVALKLLKLRHVFVVPLTNYEIISVRVAPWENRFPSQNSDERSS